MSTLQGRFRQLRPGSLVVLYKALTSALGAPDDLFFYNPKNADAPVITFQTQDYTPYPISAEGFEMNAKGVLPRPIVALSNVTSFVSALLRNYKDLVGCPVVRIITLEEFLDDGSAPDPTQYLAETFVVDRKRVEANSVVEFELATKLDAEGISLPRRQMLANSCQWLYRGEECGWGGRASGAIDDTPMGAHFTTGVGDGTTTFTAAGANFDSLFDTGRMIKGDTDLKIPRDTGIAKVNSSTSVVLTRAVAVGTSIGFTVVGRTVYRGAYNPPTVYAANDEVYTTAAGGVQLVWYSLVNSNTFPLTDETKWRLDRCGKRLHSCKMRFGPDRSLRTSAFPGINKLVSV